MVARSAERANATAVTGSATGSLLEIRAAAGQVTGTWDKNYGHKY